MIVYSLFTTAVTADIGTNLEGFFKITSISGLVSGILGAALLLAALAFILIFAWAALNWIMSEGDKSKIEAARGKLSNAFIGLLLTAAAWAVYLIVIYMLGLPIDAGGGVSSGGEPVSGTGDCNCVCGNGGYAQINSIGWKEGYCYECTDDGWDNEYEAEFGECPITCYSSCI